MQQISVLETNIGSSTTGNSNDTEIIFNDAGTLRGDKDFAWNKTSNILTIDGSATITGDLTVDTNVLKVNTTTNRVGINTTTPTQNLQITGSGDPLSADGCSAVKLTNTVSGRAAIVGLDDSQNFVIWNVGTEVSETIKFLTGGGSGKEQYRITHGGVFTWYDGAVGTRMTLNSTGLLVGTTNNFASSRLCVQGTAGTATPDVTIGIPVNASSNTNLAIGRSASTNGYIYFDAYKAGVGGTELVLNSINGGSVLIGLSTVVAAGGCLQLKSGITFPATQVASSDVNTLDDYKEGTFTATLNAGTFTSQVFKYTKIGNMVTVFFDVVVGTGGGTQITNLPYTAGGTVANGIYTNAQAFVAGTTSPVVVIGASGTVMYFRTVGAGVAFSAMTLTAGAALTGSISYLV